MFYFLKFQFRFRSLRAQLGIDVSNVLHISFFSLTENFRRDAFSISCSRTYG